MTKTKKNQLHIQSLAALSILLGIGVVIAASHLSDVIAHAANLSSTVASSDMHKKATGELHNHIEKQTLKSMTKMMGDDVARTDRRHVKRRGHAKHVHPSVAQFLRHLMLQKLPKVPQAHA